MIKKNIYEKATRNKIRFDYKGLISVEDVWDLGVTELDEIYKELNSDKKQLTEDSLLDKKTTKDYVLETKIDIIKHIVETKLNEESTHLLLKEKQEKKQKIMEILSSKQDSELQENSSEELKEMLNSL